MSINKLKISTKIDKIEDNRFTVSNQMNIDSFYDLLRWVDSKVWFYDYNSLYKFSETENSKSTSLWHIIDLHDHSYDWVDNINLKSIQLRNTKSIDEYMELESSVMDSKFKGLYSIIESLDKSLIDPELFKKLEDFFENRGRDCISMDNINVVKFFSSNEWVENFLQLIDEHKDTIENNSRIIFDWDSIFTWINNFSISNLLISLWILAHTNITDLIYPKNIIKYIEVFFNNMISEFTSDTKEISISDQFDELIPDHYKSVFVVLLSNLLINSDLLQKLKVTYQKNWTFDFLDLTTEILNNLYQGTKTISKEDLVDIASKDNLNIIKLIKDSRSNLIYDTFLKFPTLALIDSNWKNFIYQEKIWIEGNILDVVRGSSIPDFLQQGEEYIDDYINSLESAYDHIELDNFQRWILNRNEGIIKSTPGCYRSYIALQDTQKGNWIIGYSTTSTYEQIELTDNNFVVVKTLNIDELWNLNITDNKFRYIKIKKDWDNWIMSTTDTLQDWEFIDDWKYVKLKDWKKYLRSIIWL